MFLVTGKEMQEIDRLVVEKWQMPELLLMEKAGYEVAKVLQEKLGDVRKKKITIISGPGNNGGDGLVTARYLVNWGADVKVFVLDKNFKGSAKTNYDILKNLPVTWCEIDNENSLDVLDLSLYYCEGIVDAIFGTGLNREIEGLAKEVIKIINKKECLKVSVDTPSGLDSESGQVLGECIKADVTVSFAFPKIGQLISPGLEYVQELRIVDIGFPKQLEEELEIDKFLLDKEMLKGKLPERQKDSYKNNFGHLLFVGGSKNMMGAAYLSSLGAFQVGTGLVTSCLPKGIQKEVASMLPEMMTVALAEDEQGKLGVLSVGNILENIQHKDALVFGPGLDRNKEMHTFLKMLLEKIEIPFVIDADGLYALSDDLEILKLAKKDLVLTPHPGEMAKLLKLSTKEIQKDRQKAAKDLASKYGVWVVLKGFRTVIASPDGDIFINPTGCPALSTAGTGDVLAGMIGGLLAQGLTTKDAIIYAVYVHGLAGNLVEKELGNISSKARDILEYIPKAIEEVES